MDVTAEKYRLYIEVSRRDPVGRGKLRVVENIREKRHTVRHGNPPVNDGERGRSAVEDSGRAGRDELRGAGRAARGQRARSRLMTSRWIWLVPSKICITLVSRM